MNRYESIVACAVIAVFAAVLVLRFVCEIVKLLFSSVAEFFSLVPPWFWGLAIGVAIVICLIGFALMMLQKMQKIKNEASVVPVHARHVVVFHNGVPTAISFNGRGITSRQIGQRPLTQPEEKILIKMAKRQTNAI